MRVSHHSKYPSNLPRIWSQRSSCCVVVVRVNPTMSTYNQFGFDRVNWAEMARSNSYVISVVTLANGANRRLTARVF